MARAWGIAIGYPNNLWTAGERTAYYEVIKDAGFNKVRIDWTGEAGSASALHSLSAMAEGLEVLLIIAGTSALSAGAYTTKATTAATYYESIGVTEYELMNEPNLHGFATGAAYAAVAKGAYPAIKAVQPDATIHLGGIAPYGNGSLVHPLAPDVFFDSLCTVHNGSVGDWFDTVNYHPYGYWRNFSGSQAMANLSGWPLMIDKSNSFRNRMIAHGITDKKIICTEIGAPTWSDGVKTSDWFAANFPNDTGMTEAAVADYFVLLINKVATISDTILGDMYIYSAKDQYPPYFGGDKEGHFGALLYADDTPKPSATTIAAGLEGIVNPPDPPQPGDPDPPPQPPPVVPPPAFVGEGISLDGMILRHLATNTPNEEAGLGGIKLSDIKFRAHGFG